MCAWKGIAVPKETTTAIVAKLSEALGNLMQDFKVQQTARQSNILFVYMPSRSLTLFTRTRSRTTPA